MRIGVISDTHIPIRAKEIPAEILEAFKKVDLILHAGDLEELTVLEVLDSIAPTIAVQGNMDDYKVKRTLPKKKIIEVDDFKIGLTHGYGSPKGLVERVKAEFKSVDCIVFGHSHNPYNQEEDGILLFNPGSPTDKFFAPFNSYGIIQVEDEIIGEIIQI